MGMGCEMRYTTARLPYPKTIPVLPENRGD
jgi:hypothetical protein